MNSAWGCTPKGATAKHTSLCWRVAACVGSFQRITFVEPSASKMVPFLAPDIGAWVCTNNKPSPKGREKERKKKKTNKNKRDNQLQRWQSTHNNNTTKKPNANNANNANTQVSRVNEKTGGKNTHATTRGGRSNDNLPKISFNYHLRILSKLG